MAMTVSGLKSAIIAALGPATDATTQANFAQAIATAVVDYIQSNAEVTVMVTGVQSGGSTASGTGTVG